MRLSACFLLVQLASFTLSALPPPDTATAKKHALLIGIDDYQVVNDLQGCANDIAIMKSLLVGKFGFDSGTITELLNAEATRAKILRKLGDLATAAKPGDMVVIHYSGHGSRIRDDSPDEELDRWDETIVPQDSRTEGVFDITDDELNAAMARITARTGNVVLIFDSCHSGSITRGGATPRKVDDDLRERPSAGPARGSEMLNDLQAAGAQYVLIMGSRANELSNESDFDGTRHGALTYHLVKELWAAKPTTTYRDVMDAVAEQVTSMFPSQRPHVEGLNIDSVVFGSGSAIARPYMLAEPVNATTVKLRSGMVSGVNVGSVVDIFRPTTKDFKPEERVAQTTVISSDPFEAEGTITSGGPIDPHSRALVRTRRYSDFKLRVRFDSALDAAFAAAVREELKDKPFVELTTNPSQTDLLLIKQEESALLTSSDESDLSPAVPLSDARAATRIADQILQWAQWYAVRALDNEDSQLDVRLSVAPDSGSNPTMEFAAGDKIKVRITNNSDRSLYFTLLDLSNDGSIVVLYPKAGQQDSVAPGITLTRRLQLVVPEGRGYSTDTFKVLATEEPLNPDVFIQGAIKAAGEQELSTSPLARFLEMSALGSRNSIDAPSEGWDAFRQQIKIRANPTQATSFLVHYDAQPADAATRTRGSLRACAEGEIFDAGNPCYTVREFAPADGIAEVGLPIGGARSLASAGALWDKAYELRAATGAARVEPAFEADLSDWPVEDPTSTRGGIQRPDKEGAKTDPIWSLRHINALPAWDLLHARGSADGREGNGVVVGHPDTGYRQHPEFWDADPAKSPTLYGDGYDYYGADNDPTDPLDTSGLLTNPGHGTKSGSVIVSPKGKQWPSSNVMEYVSGVAPGARLIPLRVNKSVVHVDSTRLGRAIYEAAGDDRAHVKKKANVISISMGGLPSWTLWRAVKHAEKQGTIVVAAAGNEVGFVVWPARFSEVVAVAASNVDCGIWEGSSKGSAVDITAPGESVWMAQTDKTGAYSVRMGQGTTFATATTAGVAALWLDYHSDDPNLARLRSAGEVTSAFRSALQRTAWTPDMPAAKKPAGVQCKNVTTWNKSALGAGIIDAAAALAVPLPQTASRTEDSSSVSDLPLFRSLFAANVPLETVRARYHAIFRATTDAARADVEALEGELLFHYTMNENLRGLIEPVTRSSPAIRADEYSAIRRQLLRLDLSSRMRTAIGPNP